ELQALAIVEGVEVVAGVRLDRQLLARALPRGKRLAVPLPPRGEPADQRLLRLPEVEVRGVWLVLTRGGRRLHHPSGSGPRKRPRARSRAGRSARSSAQR